MASLIVVHAFTSNKHVIAKKWLKRSQLLVRVMSNKNGRDLIIPEIYFLS